ncbi:MAG TPA: sigma-70 family RNA polymerase sigma factor [Blastocatellia bacterium]|nr:sigma-70 family RNA polymerase sigma factor [Blastocatellia bacterium]
MKQGDDLSAQSTARHILAGEPPEEASLIGFHQSAGGGESVAAKALSDGEARETQGVEGPADEAGEDQLVSRTLAGDHDAFEVLVRRNSSRVFSIIGSFFRRRDMVEDIAQEVFAKAYFSLSTFTLGRSFEAWVAKIAVNACYDHLRSQRRRIEQQIPHESQDEDGWLELQMLEVARDRHASSERQRDAAEIADRLLTKLEPEDRVVVVLIDRDGFSVKEVSEMTGWGQSKVKVRAFRARRALRAAMKRLVLSGERMQRSKQ